MLDGSAAATWTVAPGQQLEPSTTRIEVLVSRLGCNSGVTGEVEEPDVVVTKDRVTLTFSVSPGEPDSASCPSNPSVLYVVDLESPLGNRTRVDGQCGTGGEAATTSFCSTGGARGSMGDRS